MGAQGTWREGYINALEDAKKNGRELPITFEFTNTYVPASAEDFIQHLKPLLEAKRAELEQSEFFKAAPEVEAQTNEPEKTQTPAPETE